MPRRWAFRSLLLFGLAALVGGPTATGQPPPLDKVHYRDRADGKVVTFDTETKESPAGVQLLTGKKGTISPADVIRIDYGDVKGIAKTDQYAAIAAEDSRDPVKARDAYADLLKKLPPDAPERTRRYLTFREAYWAGKAADAKTGDGFQAEAQKAADALAAVARATKKSWEVWPTARAAARLYTELGDHAKAAVLLGELAAVPELPRELRYEAKLAEAAATLRGGQGAAADGLLDQLERDRDFPATGPLRDRLAVLRAAAKVPPGQTGGPLAKLGEATAQAKDPAAKAVGSNCLGDAYAAAGQTRDAMWAYLWADVVYNQDKDEQVYAVGRLVGVFEKLGDKDRADQFRDRLPRVR
jgi:hypothetical protein